MHPGHCSFSCKLLTPSALLVRQNDYRTTQIDPQGSWAVTVRQTNRYIAAVAAKLATKFVTGTVFNSCRALIYPFLIRGSKGTPAHLFLLAFFFCTANGYIQGAWHSNYATFEISSGNLMCYITGTVLYVSGMIINISSDLILRNLRQDGTSGYKIPRGGFFEYVSGANFFGEFVEWLGYAIFARTLPAFAFLTFTACNIGPRAYHHHKWYQKKFEDYPKRRKAFIPFVL
ncbi:unnamed protein product [Gongylonema pulchrum]|uniref:3-oxo-5alpha-steroid 4-dehydrogenase (NADP(+)) n=1 Tax=Gongylonema pulchrum TaxID=637853 RepID=A0A183DNU1_9BILA|nr:unnamed protein product [Gongylonema pulchrum]